MKFSCEKALLQSAILTASRAVSPKSTIPALEGLLLEAEENGTVFLTGYNQETGIRSAIQADVSQPGSMVLPPDCLEKSSASCPTTWSCSRRKP